MESANHRHTLFTFFNQRSLVKTSARFKILYYRQLIPNDTSVRVAQQPDMGNKLKPFKKVFSSVDTKDWTFTIHMM